MNDVPAPTDEVEAPERIWIAPPEYKSHKLHFWYDRPPAEGHKDFGKLIEYTRADPAAPTKGVWDEAIAIVEVFGKNIRQSDLISVLKTAKSRASTKAVESEDQEGE